MFWLGVFADWIYGLDLTGGERDSVPDLVPHPVAGSTRIRIIEMLRRHAGTPEIRLRSSVPRTKGAHGHV